MRGAFSLDEIRYIEKEARAAPIEAALHLKLTREQALELCASWRAERGLLRQPEVAEAVVLGTVKRVHA